MAVPPPGRRPLPGVAATGCSPTASTSPDGLRPLRHSLRRAPRARGRVVRPLRRPGPPPHPGRGDRDHAGGGRVALPPARPGAPRPARTGLGPGRRPWHGGGAARGGDGARRGVRRGCGPRRGGRRGRRRPACRRGRGGGAPERGVPRRRRRRWRLDQGRRRVARDQAARRPHQGADRPPRRGRGHGPLADRAATADALSRALARGAGGLRGHVRGRCRLLGQRDRGRACTSCCASA